MATLLGQPISNDALSALGLLGFGMAAGNFPQGGLLAMRYLDEAPDRAMKRGLLQSQIANYNSEAAQREAATQKLSEGLSFLKNTLGRGATYGQGQAGSGTLGVVPADGGADPLSTTPARPGGLAGMTPDEIALAKMYGFDLMEPWKVSKQGFIQQPNTYRIDASTGREKYYGDPTKGVTYENGKVGIMPGFTDTTTALTLSQELPKAFAGQVFGGNIRKEPGPNGRDVFVPNINENAVLGQYANMLFGRQPMAVPQSAPAQPAARPVPVSASLNPAPEAGVTGAYDLNDPALQAAINDIKDPQERANAVAALRQQTGAGAGPGAQPTRGYGMSANEQISNEVAKARELGKVEQEKKQKADLAPETAAFNNSINGLDRLSNAAASLATHPGLTGIFGLRGAVPNIPGTEAADAQALLETLKSQIGFAVLQDMRNNSKTGGALGQVSDRENSMLQSNLAALDKAQSVEQAKRSLQNIADYAAGAQGRLRQAFQMQQRNNPEFTPPVEPAKTPTAGKSPVQTGMYNGRKVIRYSDGSISYAN